MDLSLDESTLLNGGLLGKTVPGFDQTGSLIVRKPVLWARSLYLFGRVFTKVLA